MSHAPHTTLRCIVVTPEQTVLEQEADFLALPLYDGEIGIAPFHSPMIGRLGYGEFRIRTGSTVDRYYIDGGFVQVADNTVSVLTNRALPADKVDSTVAAEHLAEAIGRKTRNDEELAIRDRLITQSRAQLRVARRAK